MSPGELAQALLRGERGRCPELFILAVAPDVRSAIGRFRLPEADLDDLTSLAQVRALQRLPQLSRGDLLHVVDPRASAIVGAWVRRLAATVALMHMRRERARPLTYPLLGEREGREEDDDGRRERGELALDARTDAALDARRALERLRKLPHRHRQVIELHLTLGGGPQLARRLRVSQDAARKRLQRARGAAAGVID